MRKLAVIVIAAGSIASCEQGKPLAACDQAKFDAVSQLFTQGEVAFNAGGFAEANRIAIQGLDRLGFDYDGSGEVIDDTGMALVTAAIAERDGNFQVAGGKRMAMLQSRLSLYGDTHSCRKLKRRQIDTSKRHQ